MPSTKILIVDHDQDSADSLFSRLKQLGYRVTDTVTGGRVSIDSLDKNPADLVLVNLSLNEKWDAVKTAREIRKRYEIPVVFLAENTNRDSLDRVKRADAYGCLVKPFDEHKLRFGIETALHRLKIEKSLKAGAERFKEIYNGLPLATLTWEKIGRSFKLAAYNDAADLITNGRVHGAIGKKASELYAEDPRVLEDLHTCLNERRVITRYVSPPPGQSNQAPHLKITYARIEPNLVLMHTEDVTEKKRSEQALRESEERYRRLFEDAVLGIFRSSPEGEIYEINPAYARMFGFDSVEDLMGHVDNVAKTLYADPGLHTKNVQRILNSTGPFKVENRYRRKDGSIFTGMLNAWPVKDRDGGKQILEGFVEDITYLKEAEKRLKEQNAFLQTLIDSLPLPVFFKDIEGKYIGCNRTFEDYIGQPREEITGKTVYELWPQISAAIYKEKDDELFEDPGEQTYETQIKHADGTWRDVIFHKATFRDAGGQVGGLVGSFTDITVRKRYERELRQKERELSLRNSIANIFLTVPDEEAYAEILETLHTAMSCDLVIFGYLNQNGALETISINRSGARDNKTEISEDVHTPDTWKGQIWEDALNNKSTRIRQRNSKDDGYFLSIPIVHRKKTIGVITLERASNEFDKNDIGLLESLTDYFAPVVNARFEKERQTLENKLLEAQLRQTQKMEAIGTLAGGIAHDFNNILAAILGYTELAMADTPESASARADLENVIKAGQRAKQLIQQILSFSRRTEHKHAPIQIAPVVKEALRLLRASLPTTIDIRQHIDDSPQTVIADPIQIHQIIMNLCANAAHAMRDSGGVLEIMLDTVDRPKSLSGSKTDLLPGKYQRLIVRDTGRGISTEIIDRIFEPFFTTKGPGEGTGMGLAVVHGLVKSYRGDIRVRSKPGQGTEFTVLLPINGDLSGRDKTAMDGSPLPRGHERIMFVDDEKTLVDIGKQVLEGLGYEAICFTSSSKALESFIRNPHEIDLLITDQTMPQMTGLELADKMMEIRPDLPVILCTGFSQQVTADMAIEMGIKKFLLKPLVVRDVAEVLRLVLDEKTKSTT